MKAVFYLREAGSLDSEAVGSYTQGPDESTNDFLNECELAAAYLTSEAYHNDCIAPRIVTVIE